MTQPRILVLDFDGVICDSTEECIVTAWNAWQTSFVRNPIEVREPFRSALREHRNYVRTAGEYLILIEAARTGRNVGSQASYDRLFDEFQSGIKAYGERFFAARDRLRNEDEPHWLDLHTVYAAIPENLHKLWDLFQVFVVTGKDSTSVQKLFDRFDLPIPPSRIYDKDAAHDKLSAIRMIAANLGQPLNSAVFVDDNVHHLLPPHQAGCHAFMAGWGYHTDEQIELAKQHSIPILELETWAGVLAGHGVTA
jgi:phosphoglycolate phosphatase-like HAD superfamily hydrolase